LYAYSGMLSIKTICTGIAIDPSRDTAELT
jgi:hypothetical protein